MTNAEFIVQHKSDDVRKLALGKVPEGIDLPFCLQQIEGWQLACKKIPQWAGTDGLLYPPHLSMEQCSSEKTALYKKQLVQRILCDEMGQMADLTGGFGIDFSYMAPLFDKAVYIEQQVSLCQIALHNFNLLGLHHIEVRHSQAEDELKKINDVSLIYADPARRDSTGRKVVLLEDCQPNVICLQDELLKRSKVVKLYVSYETFARCMS